MKRKFRIAWDIRKLDTRKAGIGNYIYHFLKQISIFNKNYEFILYTDKKISNLDLSIDHLLVTTELPIIGGNFLRKAVSPFWLNIILPRYLQKNKIDIFHSPNHLLPLFYKGKTIVTVHDLIPFTLPEVYGFWYPAYLRLLFPPTLKKADTIIAVSQTTKNDLLSLFDIKEEKIKVIYNGLDANFKLIEDRNLLEKKRQYLNLPEKFILFVGTVEYRKNLKRLLHAFGGLAKKENLSHKLVIAGKFGIGSNEIFRTVNSLGIQEKVVFLNYVSYDLLPFLYNLADIFIYPSLYEGFGLPVIEAMACGTPVITSNCSSLKEIAEGYALLVDPYKPEDITEKIELLLHDENTRRELIKKGLRRSQIFSWEKTAERILEAYDEILYEQVT